jgi:hypothetical protein
LAWGGGSGDGLARNESTIHAAAPSPAPRIHDARFTNTHTDRVCQFEVYAKTRPAGNRAHCYRTDIIHVQSTCNTAVIHNRLLPNMRAVMSDDRFSARIACLPRKHTDTFHSTHLKLSVTTS